MCERTVWLNRGKRVALGSCNACQDRNTETVLEVSLSMMTFRLCDNCAIQLSKQIKDVVKEKK